MKLKNRKYKKEIQETKKLMETIDIINKSDLGSNWSASYNINTKRGLKPYVKNGYTLIPAIKEDGIMRNQSTNYQIKNAIYLTEQQAEELNNIGNEIRQLISQFNEKLSNYAKD